MPTHQKQGRHPAYLALISLGSPTTTLGAATEKVSRITKHKGNLASNYVLGQQNSKIFKYGTDHLSVSPETETYPNTPLPHGS